MKQYLNVEKTPKLTPEIPREFDKSQHFANLRAKEMLDWLHGYDASNREVRDAVVVAGSTACSEEVSDAIKNTLDALVGYSASSYDDAGAAKVMAAVQRSEAELERYIVAVE